MFVQVFKVTSISKASLKDILIKGLYFTRLGMCFFFFTKFKGLNGKSQITRLSRASFESLEFESNLKNKLEKSSKRNYFGVKMLTQFLELEKFR